MPNITQEWNKYKWKREYRHESRANNVVGRNKDYSLKCKIKKEKLKQKDNSRYP